MELTNKIKNSILSYQNLSNKNVISIALIHKNDEGNITFSNNQIDDNLYTYDLGSLAKTFTCYLVLTLVNDGLINLKDKIDKYLDLKPGNYPTIMQLLSHTSSYKYLTPISLVIPRLICHRYAKYNIYINVTSKDVLSKIKTIKNKEYSYHYSDFNYAILSLIIEKTLNKSFDEAIYDFINNNLHLNNTKPSYMINHNLNGVLHNKYVSNWQWNPNNPYLGAGGITSNILDMQTYLKLILNSKNIPTLGWEVKPHSDVLSHKGCVGTFKSIILFNKKLHIGVAVLTNSKGCKKGNASYIANQIYGELKRNKIKF